MSVIVVKKRKAPYIAEGDGYAIPEGGEILWFGIGADVPVGFEIDTAMSGLFVKGVDEGEATNDAAGVDEHVHSYSTSTGARANHSHAQTVPYGAGWSATTSNVEGYGSPANISLAAGEHTHGLGADANTVAGGGHSHPLNNTLSAVVLPPYKRLYWIKATQEIGLPVNGIIIWDGAIGNRPAGTSLCDGDNNTIDLRDQFVYAAEIDDDVGNAGGQATHNHQNQNVVSAGAHSHTLNVYPTGGDAESGTSYGTTRSSYMHSHTPQTGATATDSNHTHSLNSTESTSNIPLFIKLYYVMRTE